MDITNGGRLCNIQPGDIVERILGGTLPRKLRVTKVASERIVCGAWEFSRLTGAEIDEDLSWTATNSGSYIRPFLEEVLA